MFPVRPGWNSKFYGAFTPSPRSTPARCRAGSSPFDKHRFCHLTKQFLCCANDCKCLGGPLAGENDDKTLGLFCTLYGLTCYPKIGCCQQVKYYYPPDEFPELAPKQDYLPCLGGCFCCCTDLCTTYLKFPTTICSIQGYVYACCYQECGSASHCARSRR